MFSDAKKTHLMFKNILTKCILVLDLGLQKSEKYKRLN